MQTTGWDRSLGADAQLRVTSDDDGAVVLMAVAGSWDWRLFLRVRRVLHKCLADCPAALIVDLHGLDDPTGASAALWLAARRTGEAMRPRVRLVLCLRPDSALAARLHRLGARWFLPIFASVAQARVVLAGTPVLTDCSQARLPPEPLAPSMARMLVADACRAWALPHLLVDGQLLVSELVSNAVEHARIELLVTVTRRGRGLYLAVRDGNPDRSRLSAPTPARAGGDQQGQRLWIVERVANAWGALATHDGRGKVVWASLQSSPPP